MSVVADAAVAAAVAASRDNAASALNVRDLARRFEAQTHLPAETGTPATAQHRTAQIPTTVRKVKQRAMMAAPKTPPKPTAARRTSNNLTQRPATAVATAPAVIRKVPPPVPLKRKRSSKIRRRTPSRSISSSNLTAGSTVAQRAAAFQRQNSIRKSKSESDSLAAVRSAADLAAEAKSFKKSVNEMSAQTQTTPRPLIPPKPGNKPNKGFVAAMANAMKQQQLSVNVAHANAGDRLFVSPRLISAEAVAAATPKTTSSVLKPQAPPPPSPAVDTCTPVKCTSPPSTPKLPGSQARMRRRMVSKPTARPPPPPQVQKLGLDKDVENKLNTAIQKLHIDPPQNYYQSLSSPEEEDPLVDKNRTFTICRGISPFTQRRFLSDGTAIPEIPTVPPPEPPKGEKEELEDEVFEPVDGLYEEIEREYEIRKSHSINESPQRDPGKTITAETKAYTPKFEKKTNGVANHPTPLGVPTHLGSSHPQLDARASNEYAMDLYDQEEGLTTTHPSGTQTLGRASAAAICAALKGRNGSAGLNGLTNNNGDFHSKTFGATNNPADPAATSDPMCASMFVGTETPQRKPNRGAVFSSRRPISSLEFEKLLRFKTDFQENLSKKVNQLKQSIAAKTNDTRSRLRRRPRRPPHTGGAPTADVSSYIDQRRYGDDWSSSEGGEGSEDDDAEEEGEWAVAAEEEEAKLADGQDERPVDVGGEGGVIARRAGGESRRSHRRSARRLAAAAALQQQQRHHLYCSADQPPDTPTTTAARPKYAASDPTTIIPPPTQLLHEDSEPQGSSRSEIECPTDLRGSIGSSLNSPSLRQPNNNDYESLLAEIESAYRGRNSKEENHFLVEMPAAELMDERRAGSSSNCSSVSGGCPSTSSPLSSPTTATSAVVSAAAAVPRQFSTENSLRPDYDPKAVARRFSLGNTLLPHPVREIDAQSYCSSSAQEEDEDDVEEVDADSAAKAHFIDDLNAALPNGDANDAESLSDFDPKSLYESRLPAQQPLYQIYLLHEQQKMLGDDEVAARLLKPPPHVAVDSAPDEADSVCDPNDQEDLASVSIRRQSSSASTDSGRQTADAVSRVTSNTSLRRDRLTAGSVYGSQRSLWCELPEVRSAGLLSTLDEPSKKLQEAYFEVITSEASYLRSINVLISHFMAAPELQGPKRTASVITSVERKHLFSNIVAIRDCAEKLLCDLESRLKDNLVLTDVCDILCTHFEHHFEAYVKYCSNQVYQDRTLKRLKASNSQFLCTAQRIETNRECQGLDMRSFLMLPMQRVTRYPLLVFAILERVPHASLQQDTASRALNLANQLVKNCNEGARRMERTEQLLEIERRLVYKSPDLKRIPLVSAGRYVVKSGQLLQLRDRRSKSKLSVLQSKQRTQQLQFFLFSDLLLIAKKKLNGSYVCKDYAQRRFVSVEPLEPHSNKIPIGVMASMPTKCHLFHCVLMQNARGKQVELLLSAESESDRERWLSAMRPPTCSNPDERIYAEWDCPQALACHNYTASQADELSLQEGELINILRKMSDGWLYGERTKDGKGGWFPSSYVQQVMNDHVRANNYRQRLRVIQAANDYRMQQQQSGRLHDKRVSLAAVHPPLLRDRLRRLSNPKAFFHSTDR